MWSVLREVARFIRLRDSDSAVCVMIVLGSYLTKRDAIQMRDYFDSLKNLIEE